MDPREFRPDPETEPVRYLRSLNAVNETADFVFQKTKDNQLVHFDVQFERVQSAVDAVIAAIERDYNNDATLIPPHGRWGHFLIDDKDRLENKIEKWSAEGVDKEEQCRRLVDLIMVSVLLDAGAGDSWTYKSPETGATLNRSEGLAVASWYMFENGQFSSDGKSERVDAAGLRKLTRADVARGLQHDEKTNPVAGLDGRADLLIKLGDALGQSAKYFGDEGRPGGIFDYLKSISKNNAVHVSQMWEGLMSGLLPIWPAGRTMLDGELLGDVWPCSLLEGRQGKIKNLAPFHKLSQWLCYSLFQPLTESRLGGLEIGCTELMTGLPEYRNGGLLVDHGVLTLKEADNRRGREYTAKLTGATDADLPTFDADDDVIVEWRVVTVGMLRHIANEVNRALKETKWKGTSNELTLQQVLEAGTWKCGRIIAKEKRPETGGPPIVIKSDGTVF